MDARVKYILDRLDLCAGCEDIAVYLHGQEHRPDELIVLCNEILVQAGMSWELHEAIAAIGQYAAELSFSAGGMCDV